ncbi:hypothetical protein PMKS-000960 [Pichia membranifaciens]|uniref:R3H domain-containing protein n=1 Tax=Pichia membranifaciens TaxID=4926 RepID=A0A1Q2YD85_9ASCO|nr:hypothetical protein PMKS-000960 [Pichia membranifaciens]
MSQEDTETCKKAFEAEPDKRGGAGTGASSSARTAAEAGAGGATVALETTAEEGEGKIGGGEDAGQLGETAVPEMPVVSDVSEAPQAPQTPEDQVAPLNGVTGQLIEIPLDSGISDLQNVEILSRHYQIPNILIKSLFDLNNKRKTQLMASFNGAGSAFANTGAPGNVCKFILELEAEIIEFIVKPSVDSWKMKPLNSYYRLLSHQLADYYHLGHILSNDGSSMVLFKINTSLINADDETKKNAKFDQSGNIRPLDFRNLKFDPQEKLNRIKLADLYKSYKDVFNKGRYDPNANTDSDSDGQAGITKDFSNLRMNSDRNINNVRIMRRASNKTLSEGEVQGRVDGGSGSGSRTHSSVSEDSLLSKEERYKLVKERIEKEHAASGDYDEHDGTTDGSNDAHTANGENVGDDDDYDDDDDAEIIISDERGENGTTEPHSTGGYRSDKGGYGHTNNSNNTNKYRNRNQVSNGYRRNAKNYRGNRHPNYNYRNQYAYYPNGQIFTGLPPQPPPPPHPNPSNPHPPYGYMIAPNSSSSMPMNMDMSMATSPIGSPNSTSAMLPSPPYYYIPLMSPFSNGNGVSMNYKKKNSSSKNRNSTEDVQELEAKEGSNSEMSLSPASLSNSTTSMANGEGFVEEMNSPPPASSSQPIALQHTSPPPAVPAGSGRLSYPVAPPNMPMMMPMGPAPVSRPMYQYYYPMQGNQYYPPNANGVSPNGMYMPMMYYGDNTNKDGNYAMNRNKKYYNNGNSNGYYSGYNYSRKSSKNYGRRNGSRSNGYDHTNTNTDSNGSLSVNVDTSTTKDTGDNYTNAHYESTVESV